MPDRVHSSDIQLFVNDQRIPAISSVSVNSSKSLTDIQRLGASHVVDRILTSNQSTTLDYDLIVTTGATGIDPIYDYQQMHSGFLSTGSFEFKTKDTAGVTTISGASLTSYQIKGSVGNIVNGSASYVGDGAISTSAGALTADDQSTDFFEGFFRPEDIEITTTTNGDEGIATSSLNIQNFSISVSIDKTPVTRLGTRVPKFRYPQTPSQGSLDFNISKTSVTGINISSLVCESGVIKIDLKDINNQSVLDFTTSGCCLESVEESTSLDDNTTVKFSYYFPIIK
jgi:hypothetical protein